MRSIALRLLVVGTVAALSQSGARGDVLDPSLHRLLTPPAAGQVADAASDITALTAYRQIVSELGVAMAPKFLSVADTVGYSGFQLSLDAGFTSISNRRCSDGESKDRCPWQHGVSGRDGSGAAQPVPGYLSTISLTVRKGIWLPLPSFELGFGATKLLQSDLLALDLYAKVALHEGFHDWPIPSIALRVAGSRLMASSQLDLTLLQIDATVSKSFGLFGTARLVPYLGAAGLAIFAHGQVLDTTPAVGAFEQGPNGADLNANGVFPTVTLMRWRLFTGFRVQYSVLVFAADYTYTLCGDATASECNHKDPGAVAVDNAAGQHMFSLSGGVSF